MVNIKTCLYANGKDQGEHKIDHVGPCGTIRGGYPELRLHSCKRTNEMVNFMCQLNWPMVFPDIWPNIILGVFG